MQFFQTYMFTSHSLIQSVPSSSQPLSHKWTIRSWLYFELCLFILFTTVPLYSPRNISTGFSLIIIIIGIILTLTRPFSGLVFLVSSHPIVYLYKRLQYAQSGALAEFNNPISLLPQVIIVCLLLHLILEAIIHNRVRKPQVIQLFVCLLIGLYVLGILYSPSFIAGIFGMRSVVFPMTMFFIGRAYLRTLSRLQFIITVMAMLCVVTGIYGLRQVFWNFHPYEYSWAVDFAGPRNISWFLFGGGQSYLRIFSITSTPYEFATLSMLGVFVMLLHFYPLMSKTNILRFAISTSIIVISLFFTAIRGAWFGCFGGILTIILLQNTRSFNELLIKASMRIVVIGLLVPVVLTIAIIQAQGFGNAFTERIESLANPLQARQMESRYDRWSTAIGVAIEHPFGLGTGSTGYTARRFGNDDALIPDSTYFQALIELGWLGMLAVLAFFTVAIIFFYHKYYQLQIPYLKHIALGMVGICVAFALRGFTMPVLAGQVATSWFWLLLGAGTNLRLMVFEYA